MIPPHDIGARLDRLKKKAVEARREADSFKDSSNLDRWLHAEGVASGLSIALIVLNIEGTS